MEYITDFISYRLFPIVLNMSLTAALVILFVLLCRRFLKQAPKIYSYALWAVVLFRLLCPVSFSADISLLTLFDPPSVRSEDNTVSIVEYVPSNIVHTGYPRVELPLLPEVSGSINESLPSGAEQLVADPLEAPVALTTLLWLYGIGGFFIYSTISYLILRHKLVGATPLKGNIYLADHITSPFVMGLFRPKIYLPSSLGEREKGYIILHEQHHIRRLDHVIKVLAFLALCIHWFNPLVWLAFILSGKDMEMSCDEAVIKRLGPEIRADYSATLLTLATGRRIFSATPLAFGEGDTSSRIKNLANWKKVNKYISFISIAAVICIAFFCAANAAGGSWVKATLGNGPTLSFTCNLEQPIVAWNIYEDVYEEGVLISSTLRASKNIPENSGSSDRRFTGSLQLDRETLSNQVSVVLSCFGEHSWQFTLPRESYTGSGYAAYDGARYPSGKRTLEAGNEIVLGSAAFSDQTEGTITFFHKDKGITGSNHTVVQYRLVTSTSKVDISALSDSGSVSTPEAVNPPVSSSSNPSFPSSGTKPQLWFDAFTDTSLAFPKQETSVSVPAFPNVSFCHTTDHKIVARKGTSETVLIEGMPIWNVYLCDLTRDQKPELCATVGVGSGIVDRRIVAYDYAAGKSYTLAYRGLYDYALVADGALCAVQTDYASGNIVNTGPLMLLTTSDGLESYLYIGELPTELPLPAVTPLEDAVAAAIKDHNRADLPDGLFHAASHVTQGTETVYPGSCTIDGGYHGRRVTVQASALSQTFSMSNGILAQVGSKFFPVTITFEERPIGSYALVEYSEGNIDTASNNEYSLHLMQNCTAQAVKFAANLDWFAWPDHIAALLDEVCSSPSYSSNYHDYISAHPEQWQELLCYGQYSLHYCFSQFLEGGQADLRGLVMASLCRQIMEGWGENFTTASLTAETGQLRFNVFMSNALEYAKHFDNETLRTQFPGSWLLIEMLKEKGDIDILSSLSREFTFTHRPSRTVLGLGQFSGKFPWGTGLESVSTQYWSSDGFDCFSFACADGTFLKGLRLDGSKDETDGNLLELQIVTPEWETCRGAFIGMPLEDFLLLYPDAIRRTQTEPGDFSYSYTNSNTGFNQLIFSFEENILTTIIAANGIDGYLY